eukprot:GHVS01074872.1.p1 GENE.GHVS01074872.1~~GHVS01074872.1.p1  ORF type:complete len:212 (+),score=14.67 GHVS01074872.1:225-860(+)
MMFKGITLRELDVVLHEITDFLNNRPLTTTRDDPDEVCALRPKDFLPPVMLPTLWKEYGDGTKDPESVIGKALVKRWEKSQKIVQEVWKSWYREYILALRDYRTQRPRQAGEIMEPSVGDVVLMDDDPPVARKRDQWKLGVIKGLIRGRDGQVRVVTVRCRGIDVERPIIKLYPIEMSRREEKEESTTEEREGAAVDAATTEAAAAAAVCI